MSVPTAMLSIPRGDEGREPVGAGDSLSSHRRFAPVADRSIGAVEQPSDVERMAHPPESLEQAWAQFLQKHAGRMLAFLRSWSFDHDQVMDRFVYICEKFTEDGFRRFRLHSTDRPPKW